MKNESAYISVHPSYQNLNEVKNYQLIWLSNRMEDLKIHLRLKFEVVFLNPEVCPTSNTIEG